MKKTLMEKKTLICFSGGLDSTYLVYKALKEGRKIQTLYTVIANNSVKVKMEKKATKLLLDEFEKEFPGQIAPPLFNSVDIETGASNLRFSQIPIWLLSILFAVDPHTTDEVQIGYVLGDDAISYLAEIRKVYKAYKPFTYKLPSLTFPLFQLCKDEIYENLPERYYRYCVYCEQPYEDKEKNFYRCGSCVACIKYDALYKNVHIGDSLCFSHSLWKSKEMISNQQLSFDFSPSTEAPALTPSLESDFQYSRD